MVPRHGPLIWHPYEPTVDIIPNPQGSSTQYLRTLVPKAIYGMVFGTRVLQ